MRPRTSGPTVTRGLRLRNWPVRSKLVGVLVIPTTALLVVASLSVVTTLQSAQTLRRGTDTAQLDRAAIAVVHELDLERDLLNGAIASGQPDPKQQPALDAQRASVDRAITGYQAALASRSRAASAQVAGQLAATRAELSGLAGLRATAASGTLSRQAVTDQYTRIITALLGIDLQAALRGGDEQLTQDVRVFADLSHAKELTAQVRGALLAITTQGRFGFGQFQEFADLLARQQAAFDQFQVDATNPQRALLANTVKGPAVLGVARIQQAAVNRQARPTLDLDPQQWLETATTQLELLRNIQAQLLEEVVDHSQVLASTAQRRAVTNTGLILLVLAVALLGALVVAQSMLGPLRRLRVSALDVAQRRLPEAVRRLRMTQTGAPDIQIREIGDDAADELGQLARAFDTVHRAALIQASEQAGLRMSISAMFLNLARRSQLLVDRQVEVLDVLERDADPDLLERLFQLDHLAARLRRHAEGLIVLSGTSDSPRHWHQPMPLVDIVRAAAQEVEEYKRVEILAIDDIGMVSHAVSELTHLLAELIENATSFSPPGAVVRIGGTPTASGYVLEIEDRGLGMSDEELAHANQRISHPPAIDGALSRVLGLYVVGRLAQRHDIKVQLRHSWYGGITALVSLPTQLTTFHPAQPESPAELPAPDGTAPERHTPTAPADAMSPPERLPLFEQAHADWFGAGGSADQRRPVRSLIGQRGTAPSPHDTPVPSQLDVPAAHPATAAPRPPADPQPVVPTYAVTPPPAATPSASTSSGPPPAAAVWEHAAPATPAPPVPTGPDAIWLAGAAPPPAGLPRRTPNAKLAPGLAAGSTTAAEPAAPTARLTRSPEEIRAMLSSYRSGLERGRRMAAGPPPSDRHPWAGEAQDNS